MKGRPRFIAGAVCPQCRAVDRMVIENDEQGRRRRCVTCGFTENAPEAAATAPATRFTRRRDRNAAAVPVRIIDPSKDPAEPKT